MWSPANKYALASPQDIEDAMKAIEILEGQLRDAVAHNGENTQQRLLELERDLEERRAWIAPIRKIPIEILSDILLRASEVEDLAPIVFTAVSRRWRNVILATPKAWSFIELQRQHDEHLRAVNRRGYEGYFPGYIGAYLERSKPTTLHLHIPKRDPIHPKYSVPIIEEHAHRIQCLTVATSLLFETQSAKNCQKFPRLKTLFLTGLGHGERLDTSFYDAARFPSLQNLHWPQCYSLTSTSPSLSSVNFPPLHHLSLELGSFPLWGELLQHCSPTLRTLRVGSMHRNNSATISVNFPLLRSLAITSGSFENPAFVIATTPVLSSLIIDDEMRRAPTFFEVNSPTVSHLRWCGLKMPFPCAGVRVLQVEVIRGSSEDYTRYARELTDVVSTYPLLRTIEIGLGERGDTAGLDTLREGVEKHLGDGVKDMLLWTDTWRTELPDYSNWICPANMPCYPLRDPARPRCWDNVRL